MSAIQIVLLVLAIVSGLLFAVMALAELGAKETADGKEASRFIKATKAREEAGIMVDDLLSYDIDRLKAVGVRNLFCSYSTFVSVSLIAMIATYRTCFLVNAIIFTVLIFVAGG